MPKSPIPPSLNLDATNTTSSNDDARPLSPSTLSPISSKSPRSNAASPMLQESFECVRGDTEGTRAGQNRTTKNGPVSLSITAIPQYPPSPPKTSPKHGRDNSKSFFSNLMASKSSHRLQPLEQDSIEAHEKDGSNDGRGRASSKERGLYASKGRDSTPDLLKNIKNSEMQRDRSTDRKTSGSDTSVRQSEAGLPVTGSTKKSKGRFGLINRTKSIRTDDQQRVSPSPAMKLDLDSPSAASSKDSQFSEPMKTAPLRNQRERAFGDLTGSTHRNRSADRPQVRHETSQDNFPPRNNRAGGSLANSTSFRESTGSLLISNLQYTSRGAADKLGKASRGFLDRITRNSGSQEREVVTDENYDCKTINLPLVKQTRRTRIASRLELSKDKTEFWMPALPWRCIDYLNMNGCEEEGLYRIPGSGRDVKHWQRRFDTEYDINLFDEPELYDINTIGSMFKAWLRDLPDEVFPKHVQSKIAEQCSGATKAPQLLKDELSKLPPFNYYLLFAITCHLSLLNSFADKNKMDYRNLCICFQPCLKIDGFCFQFLVQDWKNCWQGCWTEKEYLEEEYRVQAEAEDPGFQFNLNDGDERAPSSSGSSQHNPNIAQQQQQQQQQQHRLPNVLRKDIHQGGRLGPKVTATGKGNDNASGGTSIQSSNTSTDDQQSTSTPTTSDVRSNRTAIDAGLPPLNPLSPIKL